MCDALGRSVVSGRENASTRSPTDGTSSSDGFLPSSQSTPIDATNAMRASMDEPDDTQTSTRAVCPGLLLGVSSGSIVRLVAAMTASGSIASRGGIYPLNTSGNSASLFFAPAIRWPGRRFEGAILRPAPWRQCAQCAQRSPFFPLEVLGSLCR